MFGDILPFTSCVIYHAGVSTSIYTYKPGCSMVFILDILPSCPMMQNHIQPNAYVWLRYVGINDWTSHRLLHWMKYNHSPVFLDLSQSHLSGNSKGQKNECLFPTYSQLESIHCHLNKEKKNCNKCFTVFSNAPFLCICASVSKHNSGALLAFTQDIPRSGGAG